MLFYERMPVGETSRELPLAEVSPTEATDISSTVCRLDTDDDDRHKMKIELSPELTEVLFSVLEHYIPSRTLHSSDTNLLSVPRVRTCFGSRSFSVAAPTICNSLPFDICNSCSLASFRRKLTTFYLSTSSHV